MRISFTSKDQYLVLEVLKCALLSFFAVGCIVPLAIGLLVQVLVELNELNGDVLPQLLVDEHILGLAGDVVSVLDLEHRIYSSFRPVHRIIDHLASLVWIQHFFNNGQRVFFVVNYYQNKL
jgi:hypothetical protein